MDIPKLEFNPTPLTIQIPATWETWATLGAALLLIVVVLSAISNIIVVGRTWKVKIMKDWSDDAAREVRMKSTVAFNDFDVDKNTRTRGMRVWRQGVPTARGASIILRAFRGLGERELQMHPNVAAKLGLVKFESAGEVQGDLEQDVHLRIGIPILAYPLFLFNHPNPDVARDFKLFCASIAIPVLTTTLVTIFR